MIDGEGLEGVIMTVTIMNASEKGRENDLGMTCRHAPCLLSAPRLAGDYRLAHARGLALRLARGRLPLRARARPHPRGNKLIVCLLDETRTTQTSSRDTTAKGATASLRAAAVAVGVGAAAEIGEEPTGMMVMPGEAADMTDPREMDTEGAKKVTTLSLPTSIGQFRLA